MQKKISKLVALISMLVMTVAAVGCGGGGTPGGPSGNTGDKVKITIATDGGGLGIEWVQAAGKRFAKIHQNTNWGKGRDGKDKIGVTINPVGEQSVSVDRNSYNQTTAIYDIGQAKPISSYAASGYILDITDVMTEKFDVRTTGKVSIADKIDDSAKSSYTYQNNYYAAPSVEYYPGLAYKANLFANNGYFFASAQNETEAVKFASQILGKDFYFTQKAKLAQVTGRSCGPDGVFGTDDDGMPSSLYEFIALCEKMKKDGIEPIDFSGSYEIYYSSMLLSALSFNLDGYDNAQANYTFDSDEIEIVTGFTDENLFPGYDGAKKPTTKKIEVTEETGYYTSWSVSKYYAEAFMKLCKDKGFFGYSTENMSQREAISNFVFSETTLKNKTVGMHVDGSFWYNEASLAGYWNTFDSLTANNMGASLDPVEFGWMNLPVNFDTSVTEGNGRGQVLADIWQSKLVINANVKEDPALMRASKAFLQFLCSDAELSAFTSTTTVQKSLNYELSAEDYNAMKAYGKKLWNMTRGENTKSKVLYAAADSDIFNDNRDSFAVTYTKNALFAVGDSTFYSYMTSNSNKSVMDIFKLQAKSKDTWQTLYGDKGTAGTIEGVPVKLA